MILYCIRCRQKCKPGKEKRPCPNSRDGFHRLEERWSMREIERRGDLMMQVQGLIIGETKGVQ